MLSTRRRGLARSSRQLWNPPNHGFAAVVLPSQTNTNKKFTKIHPIYIESKRTTHIKLPNAVLTSLARRVSVWTSGIARRWPNEFDAWQFWVNDRHEARPFFGNLASTVSGFLAYPKIRFPGALAATVCGAAVVLLLGVFTPADAQTSAGVTVSKPAVRPPEGGGDTYTIVLDSQPTADVTVAVAKDGILGFPGDVDLTASPTSITFTTANWSTAQTVTISAAEDDDGLEGLATFAHSATSIDGDYDDIDIASVIAIEDENDIIGATISKTAVTPPEGGSDSYTIVLGSQPTASVTVAVDKVSGGDDNLTASPASIVFTTANWATARTVTISAAEDADGLEGTATFTHSASSSGDSTYDGIDIASVVAVEDENETIGVTVSKAVVRPPEGGSDSYTIALGSQPTADVEVTVGKASGGDDDLTHSPTTSIVFTTANWASPQTVTIAAAEDADGLEGTATFTHSASSTGDSTYDGIAIAPVVATEDENDSIGVTVSETVVRPEEDDIATYTIVLDSQPTASVTVAVGKASGGDASLTRSPPTIVFTTANWASPQTVTIAAAEDADGLEGTATFTHSASSTGDSTYDGIAIASVVAIEDENDVIGVTVSKTAVHPPEGGSDTYTIVLGTEPTADVTVMVSKASGGDDDLTHSPTTSIVFTTANWSTARTVTISAAEDDDGLEGTATFTHSASSSGDSTYDSIAIASVAATEDDNDATGAITVSKTAVHPREGGSDTYTIVLGTQPTANVTVTVSKVSGGDASLTRSPPTIVFTTANWASPQTVTITAAEDADGLEGTATFTHSATSGDSTYNNIAIASVEATEAENDTIGVTVSETAVTPPEGGSDTYTIVLDSQPTASVTVAVDMVSGGDDDLTRSPPTITFTTANWSTARTVTISAAEDDDGLEGTATFTHSVSSTGDSTYAGIAISSVVATENENDTIGVTVSKTSVRPPEGGDDTYTIVLDTQPTADVEVTVTRASGGDGDLTRSPPKITFTTADWSTPQTVTIAAAEDFDGLEGTATFTHSASSSGDSTYAGIAIASVAATEAENDTIGVTVSKTAVTPLEGSSDTYTIVLDSQPTASVTVMVDKVSGGDDDLTWSPASITFTTANWSTARTVTITAAEDDDGLEGTATFDHSVSSSGDSTYAGIAIASVAATEAENDTIGVTVSETAVHPSEGGDDTYTIVLDTQPTADVEVTVDKVSGGDDDLTRSPATITFTPANWSTPRTVTISAAEDFDGLEGTATFTHSVSSSGDSTYAGIAIASVVATENENDTIGVTVSKTAVHPPEGGSDTYTIVLGTEPTANVTVTVSKASGGDASLTRSPPTIVFTTANWASPQTVTIAAAEDADGLEGTATFTHSATSGDSTYNNIDIASVEATEAENDTIGVTVSETAVTPPEGGSDTYTIVLDTQPTASVTVMVDKVSGGDDDLTRSPASITFTTANWSTARTVTITAAEDDDGLEGTATFDHSVSSSGDSTYAGIAIASVVATENENDTIGVTVSKTEVHPPEGGDDTYTIVLDTQPTADVEVTVTRASGGDGDLTRSPPKITFTTADWSTPQTVTIAAAEDFDGLEGTATFTHSASSSGDSTYNNIDIASVAATEADNDVIGVTVSETAVTPPEGGSDTYTIVLDTQPTANVTVTVSTSGGDPDLTRSPTTPITFTTGNWSTPQTVTISAAEDADGLEGTATFDHSASSGDSTYNNIDIGSVVATENENDTIGRTFGANAMI